MGQLLSLTGTCDLQLTATNSTNINSLLDIGAILADYNELKSEYHLAYDCRLESLRCEARLLDSLAQAPFPNIYPEDSVSKKLEKKFEIERNHPVIGLEILKRSKSGNFIRLSEVLLQNKGSPLHIELRIPYLGTGAVKLLGASDEIGVRCRERGYGAISSPNDYLQIEGDYSINVSGVKKQTPNLLASPGPYSAPTQVPVTGESIVISPESTNNKYLSIHNSGPETVFLRVGGDATPSSYNVLVPLGGNYWDFRVGNQSVSAITTGGTSILMVAVASETFTHLS